MKFTVRSLIEQTLRVVPLFRTAYIQRDVLAARVEELEGMLAVRDQISDGLNVSELSAVAQVSPHDPANLEELVPVIRTLEQRVMIAMRCRDADVLPKVRNAGAVEVQPDGAAVQIMHNGVKVVAGGYYGDWMQNLITRCNGHHEPQEELLFAEIIKHLPENATMLELGGFWSFYSIWFMSTHPRGRGYVVEPDPSYIEIGRRNAKLNDCAPVFIHAFVGSHSALPSCFQTESAGIVELPAVAVPDLMATYGIGTLDLLHCDAQGIELAVLESCLHLMRTGRLQWVMVSTHSHHISGDPLTHQRCLATLRRAGAVILAEHDVQESFSGDGLIVAKFGMVPANWKAPSLTYNRYSESLFRNPLYDLALVPAPSPPQAPTSL